MKIKLWFALLISLLCIAVSGCSNADALEQTDSDDPEVLQEESIDVDTATDTTDESVEDTTSDTAADTATGTPAEGVDVDLSVMSSTMVYAEVSNIMAYPEDYLGKVIKAKGYYFVSDVDASGMYYHFVVIEDALACCIQGLEFKLGDDYMYPDDYPSTETDIEVMGEFKVYQLDGYDCYYLDSDDISVLS